MKKMLVVIIMFALLFTWAPIVFAGQDKCTDPVPDPSQPTQVYVTIPTTVNVAPAPVTVTPTPVTVNSATPVTVNSTTPVTVNPITPVTVSSTAVTASSTPKAESAKQEVTMGKAFRQFLYQDSDGFPSMPEYRGPWTGPSWNVLSLEFIPKFLTVGIAAGWQKGDYKCEFYPYRPQPKYLQTEMYIKTVGKPDVDGKTKLPLAPKYELVGFAFCRATFNGTTLSMVGNMAYEGMSMGATTSIILGASEEFDPRNWSIGINMGGQAGWFTGNEADRAYGGRAGLGASYGGSSINKGQGLVFLLADEWPESSRTVDAYKDPPKPK